jgi:rhodanese-related sulfurtransferase
MKLMRSSMRAMVTVVAVTAVNTVLAAPPIPITADETFDAVRMRADVALVDVRDPVETFFSGTPAAVKKIHLLDDKTEGIEPDLGKVRLVQEGKFLEYSVRGRYQRMQVDKVSSLETEPLAFNIPYWRRTPSGWDTSSVPAFYDAISKLAGDYNVLILYCRTGGRSSLAGAGVDPALFDRVYEIDDPDGNNAYGGFSGPTYNNAYNGSLGFPGRLTETQDHPSVSWLDSGLPVTTSVKPIPSSRP